MCYFYGATVCKHATGVSLLHFIIFWLSPRIAAQLAESCLSNNYLISTVQGMVFQVSGCFSQNFYLKLVQVL